MDKDTFNLGTEQPGSGIGPTDSPDRGVSATGKPRPTYPLPPLMIPTGPVDVLLEKQIASCAGLIEQISYYIAHDTTPPADCVNFMDRIASLMNSSATVGKRIGKLRAFKPAT